MMRSLHSQVRCSGVLRVEVCKDAARVIRAWEQPNLVTTSGKNLIRDVMGMGVQGLTHFAIGTSATAPTLADVALGAQVYRDTLTARTPGATQLICSYYLPTTQGNGSTIREVGLFNAATGPTMYARAVLTSPVVKTASITVIFTWTLSWT
jgi:hypothetical protein